MTPRDTHTWPLPSVSPGIVSKSAPEPFLGSLDGPDRLLEQFVLLRSACEARLALRGTRSQRAEPGAGSGEGRGVDSGNMWTPRTPVLD